MYSKHKDAIPEVTIQRIETIFQSIDLHMKCSTEKHIDGVFSAYLNDAEASWGTAGKGTTPEYCSASAYGESIEHLCNHFAFDINEMCDESKQHWNFLRYPDEVLLPIDNVRTIAPPVFDDMRRCYRSSITKSDAEIDEAWEAFLSSDRTVFAPYYNVSQHKMVLLPDIILSKMCGSNGGGSGNTPEEAIGHALDEAIERYVKYKMVYDKLTPPTIPKEYIQKRCPELFELITNIEEKGRLSIIVKDASLGQSFSVICILVIDRESQRYLANFGAHPCFEIALERCLTELFQDHDCSINILDRNEMVIWDVSSDDIVLGLKNWVSLLRDDIGVLPNSIFRADSSWNFEPWPLFHQYSNQMGMLYQLTILEQNGFDVYIRDNSYLGFPVYKIYIPFLSTSHLKIDSTLIQEAAVSRDIYSCLLHGASQKQKEAMCVYLFNADSFLLEIALHNWDKDSLDLLHATLLFDIGKLNNSLEALHGNDLPEAMFLKRFIELALAGESIASITHLLILFFGDSVCEWIYALSSGNAFMLIQEHCKKTGLFPQSTVDKEHIKRNRERLYMRIKEQFSKHPIDQKRAIEIIMNRIY